VRNVVEHHGSAANLKLRRLRACPAAIWRELPLLSEPWIDGSVCGRRSRLAPPIRAWTASLRSSRAGPRVQVEPADGVHSKATPSQVIGCSNILCHSATGSEGLRLSGRRRAHAHGCERTGRARCLNGWSHELCSPIPVRPVSFGLQNTVVVGAVEEFDQRSSARSE